jgi:hypothetical protein
MYIINYRIQKNKENKNPDAEKAGKKTPAKRKK